MRFGEQNLVKAIIWLGVAALATPLFISSSTLFPYIFGKSIAFRILVELMLIVYIALVLANRRFLPNLRHPLVWTIGIFLLVVISTAVMGVDFNRSFWSNQERMEGVIALLHYGAFFFILLSTLGSNKQHWLKLIKATLVVSLLISFHALGQRFELFYNLYQWRTRVSGTLGNPSFLASYLIFHVGFALLLFFRDKRSLWRLFYASVAAFELIIIFMSATRGAILGLIIAGLALLGVYALISSQSVRRYSLGALVIIIGLLSVFWFYREQPFFDRFLPLQRLSETTLQSQNVQTRLMAWQIGLEAIKDRPLLGWGMEHYQVAFNAHFNPRFLDATPQLVWFDRAHNKLIEVAVENGIIGFLSYVAIFGVAFYLISKNLRQRERAIRDQAFLLGGVLLAYFIQNLFLFDTPGSYLMLFFSLAYIGGVYGNPRPTVANVNLQRFNQWQILIMILLILLTVGVIFQANIRPYLASRAAQQALNQNQSLEQTSQLFKRAIANNTFTVFETRRLLAKFIIQSESENKQAEAFRLILLFAIGELEKSLAREPWQLKDYLILARLYNLAGEYEERYFQKGILLFKKMKKLAPQRPSIYFEIGFTNLAIGQNEEGISLLEKAVELNESFARSHWVLAHAYLLLGKEEKAIAEAQQAVELDENYQSDYKAFVEALSLPSN